MTRLALAAVAVIVACAPHEVALGISEGDNGTTFEVPAGTTVQLSLPAGFHWELSPSTPSGTDVLDRTLKDERTIWLLRVRGPGTVEVGAVGEPTCSSADPGCSKASRSFRVTLRVK